jgi:hypothetical protein
MYGVTIQEQLCPRCGIRRTVRLQHTRLSFCFNCRFTWGSGPLWVPDALAVEYPFTAAELERLVAYRAAIRAGLYHDGGADR